jgi:hypothetical protein
MRLNIVGVEVIINRAMLFRTKLYARKTRIELVK